MLLSMMEMAMLKALPLKDSLLLKVICLVKMVFKASAIALLLMVWLLISRLTSDSSSVRKQYTSVEDPSLVSTRTTLFSFR